MATRATVAFAFVLGVLAASPVAIAQNVQHLTITQPGGMPGTPIIMGIQPVSNQLAITWDGPAGYYQVLQKVGPESPWEPLGPRTNLLRREYIDPVHAAAAFQIYGPAPKYASSRSCMECHGAIAASEAETDHSHALETLGSNANNPNCVQCHTVGFGLPTGYVIPGTTNFTTPHLAGVQCENCHGPAGNHAANPDDFTVRPRVELAAEACGGCHMGAQQPNYEEWKSSLHATVTEDMNSDDGSCGRCHSGSSRLSQLYGDPLPKGDANMSITCAVCHNPHEDTGNPAQLRNPVSSTHDFFLTTSDNFQAKYDPTVNICAQCHNHRGAVWTSTSRPPHHSPQYNFLLGTVGELASGQPPNDPATHAFLQTQCVFCHMNTEESPVVTGHTFKVTQATFEKCQGCHSDPETLVEFTQGSVSDQIAEVKQALDLWATTKAPEELRTKYGIRAWEYTNVGSLSSGGPGPNSTEQALIPDNIKKARFNVYMVLHDGSFGVHNGPHAVNLLDTAIAFVQAELGQ